MARPTSGGQSFKQFALAHGGKIGLAVGVLLLLLLIIKAPVDREPAPLPRLPDEPQYFPAEQLRAVAGRGPFAFSGRKAAQESPDAPAKATERPEDETAVGFQPAETAFARGQSYVIVTGLVPVGRQRKEYEKFFAGSLRDLDKPRTKQIVPEYWRMVVERAEIPPGSDIPADDKLTWTALNETDNAKATPEIRDHGVKQLVTQTWNGFTREIANPNLVEKSLTYFLIGEEAPQWLPPLMLRNWTLAEVSHPVIDEAVASFRTKIQEEKKAATAPTPRFKPKEGDTEESEDADNEAIAKLAETYDYRLLRWVDVDVTPGMRYKYRVRLALMNPNRSFEKRYVKNAKLLEGNYREAPPSLASPVVQVPGAIEVLTGQIVSATAQGNKAKEPLAKIVVSTWQSIEEAVKTAEHKANRIRIKKQKANSLAAIEAMAAVWLNVEDVEVAKEVQATRGAWLNLVESAVALNPLARQPLDIEGVQFNTDHLVVDIRGGQPIKKPAKRNRPTAFTEPGEVLLLDATGQLVVREEIEQASRYAAKLPAQPAPADAPIPRNRY